MNVVVVVVTLLASAQGLTLIPRDGWHARPPTNTSPMSNPVPYVVIHHSAEPAACYTKEDCIAAMQTMQDMHQHDNGWADIGYSFAVGSDGNVYEGRGWSTVGAHAPGYNTQSIGICLIGNWMESLPPLNQLYAVRELIQYGVDMGHIVEEYQLVGHRQVKETLCPGDTLFREIAQWDHFVNICAIKVTKIRILFGVAHNVFSSKS